METTRRGDPVPICKSAPVTVPRREDWGHQENEPQVSVMLRQLSTASTGALRHPWSIMADTYHAGQQEGLESGGTDSLLLSSDKERLQEETQSGKGLRSTGVL